MVGTDGRGISPSQEPARGHPQGHERPSSEVSASHIQCDAVAGGRALCGGSRLQQQRSVGSKHSAGSTLWDHPLPQGQPPSRAGEELSLLSLLPWSRSGEVTAVLGPLLQGEAPASFQRGEAKLILPCAGPWGAEPRGSTHTWLPPASPFDGENDGRMCPLATPSASVLGAGVCPLVEVRIRPVSHSAARGPGRCHDSLQNARRDSSSPGHRGETGTEQGGDVHDAGVCPGRDGFSGASSEPRGCLSPVRLQRPCPCRGTWGLCCPL